MPEKSQKFEEILRFYKRFMSSVYSARQRFGRPLTLTEKILVAHLHRWPDRSPIRGETSVALRPDRVAMQDATAQMALLQYMQAGLGRVSVSTTVHCDHLIRAEQGSRIDLLTAQHENDEVYNFLKSACARHGIGFGAPGTGIIHQVILENLAFPGGLMVGTDSHTPNAGGLGMLAIGVGGADAVEVMAGQPWSLKWPRLIGVELTGELNGWTSAKDVILKLSGILKADGGTGAVIEYFGPGTASLSCTGQATIANMGAELGATTSVFPYSEAMDRYLRATGRPDLAQIAYAFQSDLQADNEVHNEPEKYFDRIIRIDLSKLEPHVVGPFTPDLARPISQFAQEVRERGFPENIRFGLIGSCTNSSYQDIHRALHIARQAQRVGLKAKSGFLITPGSALIQQTMEREGITRVFEEIGGVVLANACGPCIGQWNRSDVKSGESNSIVTSYNRPFRGRNDNNSATHAFITSPEVVVAMALAGRLTFNPLEDELETPDGLRLKLLPPDGPELPAEGFVRPGDAITQPPSDAANIKVLVNPASERLQLLEPFPAWGGQDLLRLPVLVKASGKCTTDDISPAGVRWLRYRGHLDKISDNMFSRVLNAFTGEVGVGIDQQTGEKLPLHVVARRYRSRQTGWVAVGDQNYGEGSSREHAALSPRFLGCKAVIARSFARIHRSNLWKQGILALTFVNPADYDKIRAGDELSLANLRSIRSGTEIELLVQHTDGSNERIKLAHGMGEEQFAWFEAGSFLNLVRANRQQQVPSTSQSPFARLKAWLHGWYRQIKERIRNL